MCRSSQDQAEQQTSRCSLRNGQIGTWVSAPVNAHSWVRLQPAIARTSIEERGNAHQTRSSYGRYLYTIGVRGGGAPGVAGEIANVSQVFALAGSIVPGTATIAVAASGQRAR